MKLLGDTVEFRLRALRDIAPILTSTFAPGPNRHTAGNETESRVFVPRPRG